MNKTEIIKSHPILEIIILQHGMGALQLLNKAMDKFAEEQIISFEEWKEKNFIKQGDRFVHFDKENGRKKYNIKQLYILFLKQQK